RCHRYWLSFVSYDSTESKFDLRAMIGQSFREPFTTKEAQSFCPLKDASRTKRLFPRQHESGLFVVMIRINDCKRNTVHESFFGIPGYVEEGEFHTVSVRRELRFHPGPVPVATILRPEPAVP